MIKTVKFTISLPVFEFKEVEARRLKAKRTRSQFVREALEVRMKAIEESGIVREDGPSCGRASAVDIAGREERRKRAIEAAGRFRSGLSDLSAEHDKYLDEAMASGSSAEGGKKKRGTQ